MVCYIIYKRYIGATERVGGKGKRGNNTSERTFPGDIANAARIKPHAKNVAIVTFANTPNATHATSGMFVRGQIIVAFAMSPGNVRSLDTPYKTRVKLLKFARYFELTTMVVSFSRN